MTPALLILAAGVGSRYGGLKQLEAVGPGGETLLDYAVYDAVRSGFGKLVFVIRREFEAAFRSEIVVRYESRVPVEIVYQEIDDIPRGFAAPAWRTKPWGTGHAVWSARNALAAPFAVINADDFYGREAFEQLGVFLGQQAGPAKACLVGYDLDRTLSRHGTVSRGICAVDDTGRLDGVVEHVAIQRGEDGLIRGRPGDGEIHIIPDGATVSMNCWGLHPGMLPGLEREFVRFLERRLADPCAEFYLPDAITALLATGLEVAVLRSRADWFGVTYREDREAAASQLRILTEAGVYPGRLAGLDELTTR